jgi:hypothetical protein
MVHTGQKENTETGIKRIIDDLKKRYEGYYYYYKFQIRL